jgi:RimJ/RimL family protein N-acetyltransferase
MENKLTHLGVTRRLLLRAPQLEDVGTLVALWLDLQVTAWLGGPRQSKMVEDHFREYAADPAAFVARDREWWWVIVEKSTNEIAGLSSLIEKDVDGVTETDLGYYLLPSFWGHGYAAEASRLVADFAFADLEKSSLVALIDLHNAASAAVAIRLGMFLEKEVPRSDGITRLIYRLNRPI